MTHHHMKALFPGSANCSFLLRLAASRGVWGTPDLCQCLSPVQAAHFYPWPPPQTSSFHTGLLGFQATVPWASHPLLTPSGPTWSANHMPLSSSNIPEAEVTPSFHQGHPRTGWGASPSHLFIESMCGRDQAKGVEFQFWVNGHRADWRQKISLVGRSQEGRYLGKAGLCSWPWP